MSEVTLAVFIAAVFLLAGGVKGVLGLGLPTVGMGLLSIVMTPAQAAGILVIPALVTNIWQVAWGPALFTLIRRFALMIVATVIGTFSTVEFLTRSSQSSAAGALGAVLAAYGIYGLVGRRLEIRPHLERWLSPLVGFVTGMLNGATGVFVIPTAPYLAALRLDKEELVQIVGINALICPRSEERRVGKEWRSRWATEIPKRDWSSDVCSSDLYLSFPRLRTWRLFDSTKRSWCRSSASMPSFV